jgi:hypothetical protein
VILCNLGDPVDGTSKCCLHIRCSSLDTNYFLAIRRISCYVVHGVIKYVLIPFKSDWSQKTGSQSRCKSRHYCFFYCQTEYFLRSSLMTHLITNCQLVSWATSRSLKLGVVHYLLTRACDYTSSAGLGQLQVCSLSSVSAFFQHSVQYIFHTCWPYGFTQSLKLQVETCFHWKMVNNVLLVPQDVIFIYYLFDCNWVLARWQ